MHQLHELSFQCLLLLRVNRRIIDRVGLMLWICTRIFSFYHAIQFPVERFAMRSLGRSKRLDNEEAEFHFPWQTISPAVNCKI